MAGQVRTFCSVERCGSPVLAKGLCSAHYGRLRRTGSTEKKTQERTPCVRCRKRDGQYVRSDGRVCKACYQKERRAEVEIVSGVCANPACGKTFTPQRRYSVESGRAKFCSRECKDAEKVSSGRAAEASLKSYYWRRYGLTPEQVEELRAKGCGICGAELTAGGGRWGNLHIDHDHVTGQVRGALCSECNLGIGKFKDDIEILKNAIKYLRKYSS